MEHIVHTGLYSDKAYRLTSGMLNYIKDALSSSKRTFKIRSMCSVKVKRGDDNEVLLHCMQLYSWRTELAFGGWNDNKILEHIAWMFKCHTKEYMHKAGYKTTWSRNCDEQTVRLFSDDDFIDASVADIYAIYDIFNRRKNIEKNYPEGKISDLKGTPLDPIMAEMKIAQREEIAKIEAECKDKLNELSRACRKEQCAMYTEIEDKYMALKNAATEEAAKKITALKQEMANLNFAA